MGITWFIKEENGKFVVYSEVPTNFAGSAVNYVSEHDTECEARVRINYLNSLRKSGQL